MKTDREPAHQYLLIVGAPKSGTTSLFRYLSDHPEVCPANRKETYFFARKFDINKVCTIGDTLADFEKYFSHCCSSEKIRIEATPYTLYVEDAASKIATIIPNPSVLFILRDPVKRLISDYRFHLQREHPSTRGTLNNFIEWQSHKHGDIPGLLDFGCYIRYVRPFLNVLGRKRVHILFFEEFYANPKTETQILCDTLGIDGSYYTTYSFETHNPTINYRSSWLNKKYISLEPLVDELRARIFHSLRLRSIFEKFIALGKYAYRKINSSKNHEIIFPPEVQKYLESYYKPYNDALSREVGRPIPWKIGIK
jgi:hypothetical protein